MTTKKGQTDSAPPRSPGELPIRYTKSRTNADIDAPTVEYTAWTAAGAALRTLGGPYMLDYPRLVAELVAADAAAKLARGAKRARAAA